MATPTTAPLPAAPAATRPRLILDCDPGLDDAVAIAVALAHADVVGITAVGGNVALEHTTRNALALCDLLGRPDVPVHAGIDLPLCGSLAHRATEFHGPTGIGTLELPAPSRPPSSMDAVGWIIETVRAEEGLWLVPTGPLTNIAVAFERAPDLVGRLAGIVWMGGSSTHGNTTPAAEFNAWVDPEAAKIVFDAGHTNLVMVGLNVTHTVLLDDVWIDGLEAVDTPVAQAFTALLRYYRARGRALTTLAGAAIHDALAVARVTHPQLLGGVRRPVTVVVEDGPTRGMTLVDARPRRRFDGVNAEVVEWADATALRDMVFAALH